MNDLWVCPQCGHAFVTANSWHSCGRYDLENHFRGRPPVMREVFDRLSAAIQSFGPVTVYAQKTRIVFQVRMRFASVVVQQESLVLGLVLPRRCEHPLVEKVERFGPRTYLHRIRLARPSDIDEPMMVLLGQAHEVGGR